MENERNKMLTIGKKANLPVVTKDKQESIDRDEKDKKEKTSKVE